MAWTSGPRSESAWLEWKGLIHLQRRGWRVMQEADTKGYVHPRKELDAVESYTIYQGSEKVRYAF